MGAWIKKKEPPHKCDNPQYAQADVGDQWECGECRAIWQVTGIEYGMQYDPIDPPLLTWRKVR